MPGHWAAFLGPDVLAGFKKVASLQRGEGGNGTGSGKGRQRRTGKDYVMVCIILLFHGL